MEILKLFYHILKDYFLFLFFEKLKARSYDKESKNYAIFCMTCSLKDPLDISLEQPRSSSIYQTKAHTMRRALN